MLPPPMALMDHVHDIDAHRNWIQITMITARCPLPVARFPGLSWSWSILVQNSSLGFCQKKKTGPTLGRWEDGEMEDGKMIA